MSKRIILAVLLLAVVAAVSYIKSVRGTSGGNDGSSAGGTQGNALSYAGDEGIDDYAETIDSLRRVIDARDSLVADSLEAGRLAWGRKVDSLFEKLDSLDCLIDELYLARAAADSSEAEADSVAAVDSAALAAAEAQREEIVEHYRRLYEDLPDDLSAYERRVALYEIRLQTARHYDISLGRLKEIRSESGLSY
jgi:hypothetical protein